MTGSTRQPSSRLLLIAGFTLALGIGIGYLIGAGRQNTSLTPSSPQYNTAPAHAQYNAIIISRPVGQKDMAYHHLRVTDDKDAKWMITLTATDLDGYPQATTFKATDY